jgi:hypothetical protein
VIKTKKKISNKRNFIYLFFVLFILFGGAGWNIFCYLNTKGFFGLINKKEFSEVMGRPPMWYAGPDNGRFLSGIFQQQLETASSDHFPLYAIFTYKKLKRFTDKKILSIFPSSWTPVLPVGGDVFYSEQDKILIRRPGIFSHHKRKIIGRKAGYYNKIVEENPSIRLVVVPVLYKADWMVISNHLNLNSKIFSGDQYVREFRSLLDPKIGYFWPGDQVAPREVLTYYYKTDHHLSMVGSYEAYRQLMATLFVGENEGEQFIKPDRWFVFPEIEFRGSAARKAGKFEDVFDVLEDGIFELPNFHVKINGIYSNIGYNNSNREKYLNGSIPKGKFVNHYANYFGGDYGIVEYENSDSNGRNLLVIGDSYDNALSPLISSHFRRSFFVDLRHFEKNMRKPFNVNKFIRKNKISFVVFFAAKSYLLGLSPWENS